MNVGERVHIDGIKELDSTWMNGLNGTVTDTGGFVLSRNAVGGLERVSRHRIKVDDGREFYVLDKHLKRGS